ncbi:MAG: hypothetical protein ACR2N2_05480 [Acidimicrobiia bacterium]
MAVYELKDELLAIPGVASAQVTLDDGETPIARVWLDGSREADEVRERINALLGADVPRVDDTPGDGALKRRKGLGRGLPDLLGGDDKAPSHFHDTTDTTPGNALQRVGIIESLEGVAVEVENGAGTVRTVPVGPDGSIDAAVIEAVCSMIGITDVRSVEVNDLTTDEGELVVATARDEGDERIAGAAFVDFGRPWAVAKAILQAFDPS